MSMWSRRRARPVALALAAALAWSAGLWLPSPAGAATPANPTLVLAGQSQWVTPAAGQPGTFTLDLTARGAPAGAQVEVLLYPRLDSRDHFEQVVAHGPRNAPISVASPAVLSQLPADPHTPGGVDLQLQVVTTPSTGGGERLGLGCTGTTSPGTCTGVYPVTVALLDSTGVAVHRFTTFLTFSAAASTRPLNFAWVVPVGAPVAVDAAATSPASALRPLGRSEVSALAQEVDALRAAPTVPVTVEASPATLEALESGGAAGRQAVATLAELSGNQAVDEVPAAPYVPVNLAALAGAGESTEVAAQMAAGATVLHRLHVQTSPSLPWVTASPQPKGLGSGLSQVHAGSVVVQDKALASTPTAPPVTWASTFHLALSTGSGRTVAAADTDTFLDGQFGDAGADPALAATQVLADLAMVHFELPYTTDVRGMVAVPPAGWSPNPTFVRTLLAGLDGNPVVAPVTLTKFFSAVTSVGARSLGRAGKGGGLSRARARSLSSARVRLSRFGQSVEGRPAVLAQLDHLLLASESDRLTGASPAGAVTTFSRLLARQLRYVSFADGGIVTLTARTGVIPVTVVSKAPYTIVGTLTVSGAKFQFPAGSSHTLVLDHTTNPWRVSVVARSSGDLPLHVTFSTPSGLVIAQEELVVRSTATSLVGVVLTVLALVVLLAWWARTWRARRRRRRHPSAQGPAPERATAAAR